MNVPNDRCRPCLAPLPTLATPGPAREQKLQPLEAGLLPHICARILGPQIDRSCLPLLPYATGIQGFVVAPSRKVLGLPA